jgi:RimJ/RimL family protein N-acetyltransferase
MKVNHMHMSTPLFEGQLIRLAAINHEQDAEIESRWTLDGDYQRMLGADLVRPLSPAQVKKRYGEIEKEMDEKGNQYYFSIRRSLKVEAESPDRLLGFARLTRIEWSHGTASLSLGIGDPAERKKGYGAEALSLMLGYAFRELNLFRISGTIPVYNEAALKLFDNQGFKEEVRQREVFQQAGKRWDGLIVGLLREEWEQSS